ncbi:MAG TPA: DUF1707 domain-containing protein [Actinocrinis sp.]|jgi:hypothetical protein
MSQANSGDSRLRASDADRERIVEKLRSSAAEGRLTMDEFEQRMSAAYAARTYGDLAALTADLPVDLSARTGSGRAEPQDSVPNEYRSDGHRFGADPGFGSPATFGSGAPRTERGPIDAATDVIGALVNAGADLRAQREIRRTNQQIRMEVRQQRHEARMARRTAGSPGGALGGWVVTSVLLTGIWFIQLVTDPHGGHYFWPAWPIGIIGILALLRSIRLFGSRRY